MAEILVEKLGVPALYLANKVTIFVFAKDCLDFLAFARLKLSHITQAVMSLYGGGQMTGVAVDSGQVVIYMKYKKEASRFCTLAFFLILCFEKIT